MILQWLQKHSVLYRFSSNKYNCVVCLPYRTNDFLLLIQKFVTDMFGFRTIFSMFACRFKFHYPAFVYLFDPIFVRVHLVTLCEMKSWHNQWAKEVIALGFTVFGGLVQGSLLFYANENTIVSLLNNFAAIFVLDLFFKIFMGKID